MSGPTDSEVARKTLRLMPKTRDAVLDLLLTEAGLAIVPAPREPLGFKYVKTCNCPANLGVTPEVALAVVIARHLRTPK